MYRLARKQDLPRAARESAVTERIWRSAVQVHTPDLTGSGVILANEWILTASHAIGEAPAKSITVLHPAGNAAVKVCEVRANWMPADLAILKLTSALDAPPAELAEHIAPRERVIACDMRGLKRLIVGREMGESLIRSGTYNSPTPCSTGTEKTDLNLNCLLFNMFARPGNSGGGIYTTKGQLVSLFHAYDKNHRERAYGAELHKLRSLIGHVLPQLVHA